MDAPRKLNEVTHALMSGGYLSAAVETATGYAARLDHDLTGKTPHSLSVYGALLQRGRHENAYLALRAAHQDAPEEVTGRATVRAFVRDLAATAPVSVRRDAVEFAASIGATE